MKKMLLPVLISLLVVSCQPEGRTYIEHQELSPNIEWLKKDVRTFEVPVNDSGPYDMKISFRYANGYQYQTANIKITETTPSGEESSKEYALKIREDNGDYIGEAGYDIWDSEHLIEANKKYKETGIYTYKIEHVMPNDPLNFAMEIGMILDKVK